MKKSKGLGDTIEKFTHFFKLNIVAEWIAKLFGKEDCGCNRRRDKLNKAVPYKRNKIKSDLLIRSIKQISPFN